MRAPRSAEQQLGLEYAEVEAAVALVRSGTAVAVNVSGLRFGEAVLERMRRPAADQGILLEPLWWPDDTGCDIVVKRSHG